MPHPSVLIFDLGGVFIHHNYGPNQDFIAKHSASEKAVKEFYYGPAYHQYEMGRMTTEEFWKRAQAEAGYTGDYASFRKDYCQALDLHLNEAMYGLLLGLKLKYGREVELWLLSNISEVHFEYINRHWPGVFSNFFRVHLSFQMGCRKPDPEIYERVLREGGKSPYQCAFIDDLEENGAHPRRMGMFFHRFENVEKLRMWLRQVGIVID